MRVWFLPVCCLSAGLIAGCRNPAPLPPVVPPSTLAATAAPMRTLPPPDLAPYEGTFTSTEWYHGDYDQIKLTRTGSMVFSSYSHRRSEGDAIETSGTFDLKDEQILLKFPEPFEYGIRPNCRKYYPVAWGARLYLIQEDKMLGFCSRIARGWRPDNSRGSENYYLREGDDTKSVRGLPTVPTLFQPVLRKPFYATITSIKKKGPIILDRGRRDGIVLRTRFSLAKDEWTSIEAVRVSENTTECRMWWNNEKGHPRIGTKVYPVAD